MRNKVFWFLSGVLSTILVISIYTFSTSYERNVDKMLMTRISYKGDSVETALSADALCYLTHGYINLYFGELPNKETAIEINSPSRATLYVYSHDDKSKLIRYEPRNGIPRNYIQTGNGDFNRYLKIMYNLTDNEVYNTTVELPKAEKD